MKSQQPKTLNEKQIKKMMKLTCDLFELPFEIYKYTCDLQKYSWALESEANNLTESMFGLDGRKGQGVKPEIRHYSGLEKSVNARIKELGLDWKVKEVATGNGWSMYTIA